MSLPPLVFRVLLPLLVLTAAFFDVRSRRIPNWLSLAGVLLGIALNMFLDDNWMEGLRTAVYGLFVAFAVYFVLYLLRGMGAGDVKLMAAVGAMAGWANWLGILFLTAIAGAIAAIVLVAAKGRLRRTFQNMWLILVSLRHGSAPYKNHPDLDVRTDQGMRLPHAVVIACGTIIFLAVAQVWAPR